MMRLSCALPIALGLLFGNQYAALSNGRGLLSRGVETVSKGFVEGTIKRRDVLLSHTDEEQSYKEGADEVDDEESDYTAGVYERLSGMLDQIQPSVDQIQTLLSNVNDMNAEEYADQLTTHLENIATAGDSVADQMSTSDVAKREVVPRCDSCDNDDDDGSKIIIIKKHKRKHCILCKKRTHRECGGLLWRWLKMCHICITAIASCKVALIKERCHAHLVKVTSCYFRVITTCGKYGIAKSFETMAQIDIQAFHKTTINYGYSKLS